MPRAVPTHFSLKFSTTLRTRLGQGQVIVCRGTHHVNLSDRNGSIFQDSVGLTCYASSNSLCVRLQLRANCGDHLLRQCGAFLGWRTRVGEDSISPIYSVPINQQLHHIEQACRCLFDSAKRRSGNAVYIRLDMKLECVATSQKRLGQGMTGQSYFEVAA